MFFYVFISIFTFIIIIIVFIIIIIYDYYCYYCYYWPLYIGPIVDKSILNKLVCKFGIMGNIFSCKYVLIIVIDARYYRIILVCFILNFDFHHKTTFKFTSIIPLAKIQ